MFEAYASRLLREDWSSHSVDHSGVITALMEDVASLRQALAQFEPGQSISVPDLRTSNLPPVQRHSVPGLTMFAQELASLGGFGTPAPLTQSQPLTVDVTFPSGATEDAAAVTINAYNADPLATDPAVGLKVNGSIVSTGGFVGAIFLATATANWTNSSPPSVAATDSVSGLSVTIYLPRTTADKDPNVVSGASLLYSKTANGTAYAISDYLDEKIGALAFVATTGAIRSGWQVADGTNGTLDLVSGNRFLKMHASTSGTQAAESLGTSTTGVTVDSNTTGISASSTSNALGTVAITVSDHSSGDTTHNHTFTAGGSFVGAGADIEVLTAPAGNSSADVGTLTHTVDINATASNSINLEHSHTLSGVTDPGHDHGISDSGHSHSGVVPVSVTAIPIQRINNAA